MKPMMEAVLRLRHAFYLERGKDPAAVVFSYEDWNRIRSEVDATMLVFDSSLRRPTIMGMRPLLSRKQPTGFPVCLDRAGVAGALDAGAVQG